MKKAKRLGDRIRDARESAEMTQTELAEAVGMSRGQTEVSRWERQADPYAWGIICRIADAVGVSVADLRP